MLCLRCSGGQQRYFLFWHRVMVSDFMDCPDSSAKARRFDGLVPVVYPLDGFEPRPSAGASREV